MKRKDRALLRRGTRWYHRASDWFVLLLRVVFFSGWEGRSNGGNCGALILQGTNIEYLREGDIFFKNVQILALSRKELLLEVGGKFASLVREKAGN